MAELSWILNIPIYPLLGYIIYASKKQSNALNGIIIAEERRGDSWKKHAEEWEQEINSYKNSVVQAHKEDWEFTRNKYKTLQTEYEQQVNDLKEKLLSAEQLLKEASNHFESTSELFQAECIKIYDYVEKTHSICQQE